MLNDIQILILGALHSGPKTSGQISRIGMEIKDVWRHTRSQIYRDMFELVKNKMVEEEKKGIYEITDIGRYEYAECVALNNFEDQMRNSWFLRLMLTEHDQAPIGEICKSASAYHLLKRNDTHMDILGELVISYHDLMIEWFNEMEKSHG